MSFSFASRIARGGSRRDLWVHVARRALIIYGLGLFMAAYPGFDFATVRLVGVLARIGIVYLVAGTLVLFLSRRAVFAVRLALLAGYWALMSWVPVPGFGAGDLSPDGNLAAHLDRLVLGVHMWSGGCEHAGGTVRGGLSARGAPWPERRGGHRNRRQPPHAHGGVGPGSGRARLAHRRPRPARLGPPAGRLRHERHY